MSAILVGTLVFCGAVAVLGITSHAISKANEERDLKKRIQDYKNNNDVLAQYKGTLEDMQSDLSKAKTNLTEAKELFRTGGHVSAGVPLAKNEFDFTISKLTESYNSCTTMIEDVQETIDSNLKQIEKDEKRLQEIAAEKKAAEEARAAEQARLQQQYGNAKPGEDPRRRPAASSRNYYQQ